MKNSRPTITAELSVRIAQSKGSLRDVARTYGVSHECVRQQRAQLRAAQQADPEQLRAQLEHPLHPQVSRAIHRTLIRQQVHTEKAS